MSAILDQLQSEIEPQGLDLLGGFNPAAEDGTPEGCKTLLLLGPSSEFWSVFSDSPECSDRQPDPVDRWSLRVISHIAEQFRGTAVFPFGGPPYAPFYSWAMKTGRIWSSPLKLAVHDTHGLFVSFRGAICLPECVEMPRGVQPCDSCEKPCESACPVSALTPTGYDVEACKTYLNSETGEDCMSKGCSARRACPVGQNLRPDAQSAYHMSVFNRG